MWANFVHEILSQNWLAIVLAFGVALAGLAMAMKFVFGPVFRWFVRDEVAKLSLETVPKIVEAEVNKRLSASSIQLNDVESKLTGARDEMAKIRRDIDIVHSRLSSELDFDLEVVLDDLARHSQRSSPKRIVWIDDNPDYIEFIREYFERYKGRGLSFKWVPSNDELRRELEKNGPADVYVTDINRPPSDTDGFDSAAIIREQHPNATIFVCAGRYTLISNRAKLEEERLLTALSSRAEIIRELRKHLYLMSD